jgi:hypothetical protein
LYHDEKKYFFAQPLVDHDITCRIVTGYYLFSLRTRAGHPGTPDWRGEQLFVPVKIFDASCIQIFLQNTSIFRMF